MSRGTEEGGYQIPPSFQYRKLILGESSGGSAPVVLIHKLEQIEGPAAELQSCRQAGDPGWTVDHEGDWVILSRITTTTKET
jgi:hypothetical protein